MKRSLVLSLLACFPLTNALHAATPDCGARPISIALYEFGLLFNNGRGIDRDVIDELRHRSGCRFDISVRPRARIWQELEAGTLDMSVSGIQNPTRDRFAWFAPYLTLKNISLLDLPAGSPSTASAFLADTRLRWGAVRAFRHGESADTFLDQLRQQGRVLEGQNVAQVFAMLKSGRVQGMFAQSPVYRMHLTDDEANHRYRLVDWAPHEAAVPHSLILAKSRFSAEQAALWQGLVQSMVTDGTMLRILQRYLPKEEAAAHMLAR